MASNSYSVKRSVTSIPNDIPVPTGWMQIDERRNDPTGFTARAYKSATGDIVIAFTGTTLESSDLAEFLQNFEGDWILGNGLSFPRNFVYQGKGYNPA